MRKPHATTIQNEKDSFNHNLKWSSFQALQASQRISIPICYAYAGMHGVFRRCIALEFCLLVTRTQVCTACDIEDKIYTDQHTNHHKKTGEGIRNISPGIIPRDYSCTNRNKKFTQFNSVEGNHRYLFFPLEIKGVVPRLTSDPGWVLL